MSAEDKFKPTACDKPRMHAGMLFNTEVEHCVSPAHGCHRPKVDCRTYCFPDEGECPVGNESHSDP